jgi:hypothetical protein
MTQEEPVTPGGLVFFIGRQGLLADRQSDGAIRILTFDAEKEPAYHFIREERIFSALKNVGPKAQLIAGFTTLEDLVLRQTVALSVLVAATDAAV